MQNDPDNAHRLARVQIDWSEDYRVCTATGFDDNGTELLSVRFRDRAGVLDPVVRLRIEAAAARSLHEFLSA